MRPIRGPKMPHFQGSLGFSMGQSAPPRAQNQAKNTCLSTPNGLGSLLEKCVFGPFLTHFWSQNGPFSRHFGIFHGPKRITTGSKRAQNTCLSIPSGLGTTLKKNGFFSSQGPRWTHCWPKLYAGCAALRLHQMTTTTGVYTSRWAIFRLGNHKKWGVAGGLGALGIQFEAT